RAAELASEAARAEGASPSPPPTVAGTPGPGQAVKGEWLRRGDLRGGGCRTFALDRRAARPGCTTGFPASLVASKPGGDIPRPLGSSVHVACRHRPGFWMSREDRLFGCGTRGPQPERGRCRFHALVDDRQQLCGEGFQVDVVAQADGEGLHRPGRVVA